MQDSHQSDHSASASEVTSEIEPSVSASGQGNQNSVGKAADPPWSSEPFRAFFPLGLAAAILGTAIWPLFHAGWWHSPLPVQHPRLMIFGFGGAFVVGFLGTAWPRMVEAQPMRTWELSFLAASWFIAQVTWLMNQYHVGDIAMAIHLLALILFLFHRAKIGTDQPPASLWMAVLGPVLGATAIGLSLSGMVNTSGLAFHLSRLFGWQGMLLLPLLGVGAFFFPRFFPESQRKTAAARRPFMGLIATALIGSFFLEAAGWVRCGNGLRFGTVLVWALRTCPALLSGSAPSTRAWALRFGLGSIALSFLIRAVWPGPGYAMEHLMFISGFGLALALVAERVTLGHSDQAPRPEEKSTIWKWLAWLLLVAATTRMSADMKASLIKSHHIYAALIWIGVLVAWASPLLRHWRSRPSA
jgi:uncharacterized protein involved in response to NO